MVVTHFREVGLCFMSNRAFEKLITVTILGSLIAIAHADDITTLPPVRAVLGENVICYGYDCADIVLGMIGPPPSPYATQVNEFTEPQQVDKNEFCRQLKDKKPEDCNGANPPSTPGTDPNWQPNGCGTDEWIQKGIDLGVNLLVPSSYSGDHNSPYTGISFEAACNKHDACWGRDFDRGTCDMTFNSDMVNACSVLSNPSEASTCEGLAGFYFGVVASTRVGDYMHGKAVDDLKCAMWTQDMVTNGCTE